MAVGHSGGEGRDGDGDAMGTQLGGRDGDAASFSFAELRYALSLSACNGAVNLDAGKFVLSVQPVSV